MNREIKFRALHKTQNKFVYGFLTKYWNNQQEISYVIQGISMDNSVISTSEINPETVGQFTGLKDNKNNDIYFGDLVKAPSGLIFEVIYYEEELRIALRHDNCIYGFNVPLYEVVGNIHENPELLK